ncbi:MAG: hypothetical protein QM536_02545 [Chitinophagaceae bacterium]|nr:hypothetical protein [Chitinophagaceae bacterium]
MNHQAGKYIEKTNDAPFSYHGERMKDFLNTIFRNNTIEKLQELPSNSVDLGVTSPPYNKG